ncbi:MAG: methyltransferase domain-containing protein [Sandaracinaceae bacterium]|nr:methyltransferase domain-containing protein [Sandaracinaceae bacterium]
MLEMTPRDFTTPYRRLESWVYDTVLAPATAALADTLGREWLDRVPRGGAHCDVGGGGGQLVISLARRRPDLRVTRLDRSPEQIARARRRAGVRVELVVGSALALPFRRRDVRSSRKRRLDQALARPAAGLSECVRVLAPGGHLLVAEADRGCHLDDAERFVARTRLPRAARALVLPGFRTWVAGRGIDLDDARALVATLPASDATVMRAPGAPALVIEARRP